MENQTFLVLTLDIPSSSLIPISKETQPSGTLSSTKGEILSPLLRNEWTFLRLASKEKRHFSLKVNSLDLLISVAIFKDKAYFPGVTFKNGIFMDAIFRTRVTFEKALFEAAFFYDTIFQGVTLFSEANFETVNFDDATFEKRADFSRARLQHAHFIRTKFQAAYFSETKFEGGSNFLKTNFLGEAYFIATKFIKGKANFHYALFEGKEKILFDVQDLSRVSFLNTDITQIRFGRKAKWKNGKKYQDKFKVIEERELEEYFEYTKSLEYLMNWKDVIKEGEKKRNSF